MKKNSLFKIQSRNNPLVSFFFILILILLIDYIVYTTNGTIFAYTHLMYIPIIISAFVFGVKGGIAAALAAGIALGPWMPLDVSQGVVQSPSSWIIRMIIFMIIGSVVGLLFHRIISNQEIEIKNSYEHIITGYPNSHKLKSDLHNLIGDKKDITLVAFKILNLDQINIYVNYEIGKESVLEALKILTELFDKRNIYSLNADEMVVMMCECNVEASCLQAKKFLDILNQPIFIDGLPICLTVHCGIINYPLHSNDEDDLFVKLRIILGQEEFTKNQISIYDRSVTEKNKENYETVIALYDAIEHDKFTLVYQPKINLLSNEVMGVEALLRWNSCKGQMNVAEFIKIAEDSGIITEITNWVIRNTINQLKTWQEEGVKTKVAVNISSMDLKNDSIVEYTKNCLELNHIDPSLLEFELTERSIIENDKGDLLNKIKNLGVTISLDDFGTGYNSLLHLINFPIDYIKIDKVLIDEIKEVYNSLLIECIIHTVHALGKKVIAEGVETEKQLLTLKKMGCDNIQGYYYSRPLPPEEIKDFILNFNT